MKRYLLLFIIAVFLGSPGAYTQHSGPENQSACLGETVAFIVEHSFDFTQFTWEQSTDNISFQEITASSGYSGINDDVLYVYTGFLNPTGSGLWRYYRCQMTSTLSGMEYSQTAYLEINFPPVIDFTWTNPCQGQTVHFNSTVTTDISPNSLKYLWTFGDELGGTSVYPDPSYLYNNSGSFYVTLSVEDEGGCVNSRTDTITIYDIPSIQITGKDVVCSNEQDVKYKVELGGSNIRFKWDISGFGTIENDTLPEINIDWNAVEIPTQKDIFLTVTLFYDNLFCSTKISKEVLITTYKAPPEGEVFRKPVNSSLLIYKGPEVKSYKWGKTEIATGNDAYIPAVAGGERLYCDFGSLEVTYDYWVETSYDSRINCVTRSYFDFDGNKQGWIDPADSFKLYPVPASDYLTIQSASGNNTSEIVIYNLMMQEVLVERKDVPSENVYTISLKGLLSGVYIIQITDDSGMNYFRVFNIEK